MNTDIVNVSYLSKNTFKYSIRGSSFNYSTTSCVHHQSSVPVTQHRAAVNTSYLGAVKKKTTLSS